MPNFSFFNNFSFNNIFNFSLLNIDFNLTSIYDYSSSNNSNDTKKSVNIDTFTKTDNTKSKTKKASLNEYNAKKGEKLAKIALKNAAGWKHLCATYVKNDIQEAGLGEYIKGDAYQMINILRQNKNFKEISPNSVSVQNLPAGCVLVYDKGVQGYNSKYGHTEITAIDKNNKTIAVSDGITRNLYKKPSAIFIPV